MSRELLRPCPAAILGSVTSDPAPATESSAGSSRCRTTLDDGGPAGVHPDRSGERVGGYLLERALGSGATGVVYRARREAGPPVALKLLPATASPGRRERLQREWRALARLDHPGLVRVLEGGDSPAGPWLAMELVDGVDLGRLPLPVPLDRALEVAERIARAMDHAHRRGVVHRDLKPQNVLVGRDGGVKVADFGLVRDLEGSAPLTADGALVGTPAFMAPEQVLARRDAVGAAADVHAVGAILYLLVTGAPAFTGDRRELFRAILDDVPPPPSRRRPDLGLPPELDLVLARALAKRPRDRYPTAQELAADLAALRRGEAPRHAGQAPDPADPALSLATGDRLGPWELLYPVGHGGSAVVWKGVAPAGEAVAIKVLRDPGGERRARFEREQRLLEDLAGQAAGFVPLLAHGVAPAGPWFAMPFLPGGTLRDRLERGPLAVEEALAIARAVAAPLAVAHARGVAHRDLKPENILFDEAGEARVADLGLARRFRRDQPAQSTSVTLALEGRFLGSVGYVAPEQLEDPQAAGPRADVFSLGAVLYECLTGAPAFGAETFVGFVQRLMDGAYAPLRAARPEVPTWLEALVTRALELEPRRRFADAAELARALEAGPSPPGLVARLRGHLGRGG